MSKKIKSVKLTVENCMQCPYGYIQHGDELSEIISATVVCQLSKRARLYEENIENIPKKITIPEWCELDNFI